LRVGQLKVKHTEEGLLSGYQTKDFRLESGESTPRVVRMVFSPGWTSSASNKIDLENINLVSVIHCRQDNLPPRPLIVMDRVGGTEAATYCALSNLFRQVSHDASVDIYLTCKTLHDARPGVWTSPDNILALYKAVELFLSSHQKQNGIRTNPEGKEDKKVTIEVSRTKQSQF